MSRVWSNEKVFDALHASQRCSFKLLQAFILNLNEIEVRHLIYCLFIPYIPHKKKKQLKKYDYNKNKGRRFW